MLLHNKGRLQRIKDALEAGATYTVSWDGLIDGLEPAEWQAANPDCELVELEFVDNLDMLDYSHAKPLRMIEFVEWA